MKKLYCLLFLFFALSVRGEELGNSAVEVRWRYNSPPIVKYGEKEYFVVNRNFGKMRVVGEEKIKYIETPEEIRKLLREENNKKIKSRNRTRKKKS